MKNRKNKTKRKPLLFKFVKSILSLSYKKYKLLGLENIPAEPSIIVGNHVQATGPISAEICFPYNKKIWCIGQMMNYKTAPPYAFDDFYKYKPKCLHWFYKIIAFLISPILVYVNKHADTIAVYKDGRGLSTFKNSAQSLKDGNHLIIFPECHTPFNEIVNDFQTNFVNVAKLHYKTTNVQISFVPMYIAPKIKTIVYGKPIKFDANINMEEQQQIICTHLKTEITKMAKELPIHTVVPYANVPKKQYPKSK